MKNIKDLIIASALSIDGSAHKWWIYNMGDGVDVILSGAQTVNADIYPVTLNVAAYQA
ncbi:TPA: hypothetical protein ACO3YK_000262 [Salmonella enterica subsp. enterica serovar Strathcona]|uniref:hypothetical protein n=1 Tax=Salmonella TaxID=590 RepID=UPI00217CEB13|nr:hypothetical protein [Salmonella enterica]